ncbi:DegV family protein [Paenibacillus alvei]|uniref:DegV family protein n=1 Tax=Paenibacillus alvei TaxID=44250 RepID=UPI0018CE0BF6|nr:DegV family protein [Paenibacillus alvei]MBG9733715.1 DegV [Paenibacillus alvei]MBG9745742.1 DegV [Paenibacillus alvei]MCY9580426.1 DegV family protein [Paenibacillus alvei]MCY9583248.1 DegV family protein [Paenibacillus alvei]
MNHIKIFSDSTCDLPKSLLERYDIGIIPLYVTFGDDAFRDGVDMTPPEMYKRVDECGKLPKTSSPSPADFMQAFEPFVKEGRNILYIGLSSHLSSTIQNATIAGEMLGEGSVTVIDSLNLSTGIGIPVLKAAMALEAGTSLEDTVKLVEDVRGKMETEFIIDTLDYLYKGGRCSGLQNLIGSLLRIRPVIKVVDGKMTPANKIRGKREKALEQLKQNALNHVNEMDKDIVFVTHSLSLDDAHMLQEELIQKTGAKHVFLSDCGCVISSHCGPNTIGIVYARK